VVLTYHCDLLLPRGFVNALANWVSDLTNHVSSILAHAIVTNTQDYAESSPFLRGYLKKVHAIYVPVELAPVTPADLEALRQKANIQPGQRIISMVARLASEKGVEFLAHALPAVLERHPQRGFYTAAAPQRVGRGAMPSPFRSLPVASAGSSWCHRA
jgi:glycosyltransferase involved in cell wall biosynthesis